MVDPVDVELESGAHSRRLQLTPILWFRAGYSPMNDPYRLVFKQRWQPLLEQDGKGYFTNQQHVTPYIGGTARLYGLDVCDIADRRVEDPRYDLLEEIREALETTRQMATDDRKKMLVGMS